MTVRDCAEGVRLIRWPLLAPESLEPGISHAHLNCARAFSMIHAFGDRPEMLHDRREYMPPGLLPEGFVSVVLPVGAEYPIHPDEALAVQAAGKLRRDEFAAGRACVHMALGQLGHPDCPVPVSRGRAPAWPAGIAGSISHSRTLAVAALTRIGTVHSIGIDIEPTRKLDAAIWPMITSPDEPPLPGDRAVTEGLRFSCKEAAFKCWFQAGGDRIIEFLDVRVEISPNSFVAILPPPGPSCILGRWAMLHDHWWAIAWT